MNSGAVQHLYYIIFMLYFSCLPQPLELRDHALDHAQAALPEGRVAGIEPERLEQLAMMLGATGRQHRQVAMSEALGGALIDRIERVHQAVAERIGVDVEGRVHEVRDIGPEALVAGPQVDRGAKALALHLHPERRNLIRSQLAMATLAVDLALEGV